MDKNQDNLPNGDDEFQFSEEDDTQKYQSPAAPIVANGENGARRKKMILLIAGGVIGLFVLYKLYGLFTTSSNKVSLASSSRPVATMPAPTAATPTPAVVSPPQEEVKSILPPKVEEKEPLKDQVAGLEQAIVQVGQTQENLQNQIAGLSTAVSEIQNNLAILSQKVATPSQKPTASEGKPKKSTVVHKPVKKPVKKPASAPVSVYYVKALIQGRAWLMSGNGAAFTVGVGDSLPGYGIIQTIDPSKGVVMTSSGKEIGFMPLDR